jgi:hypothetical protein
VKAIRCPDGGCDCGEDTDAVVAFACKACRELEWGTCDKCGDGRAKDSLVWNGNVEGPICTDCDAEFCRTCGMEGYCRCCHADDLYDAWKDEGRP